MHGNKRLPTLYLPHGGGPCFFMDWTMGPPNTWERMRAWLEGLGRRFADVSALLVVSAHWEEATVTVQTLQDRCTDQPQARDTALSRWEQGPQARFCHPREEHLLPLMVAAGAAADEPGRLLFRDQVMGAAVSAFQFGGGA